MKYDMVVEILANRSNTFSKEKAELVKQTFNGLSTVPGGLNVMEDEIRFVQGNIYGSAYNMRNGVEAYLSDKTPESSKHFEIFSPNIMRCTFYDVNDGLYVTSTSVEDEIISLITHYYDKDAVTVAMDGRDLNVASLSVGDVLKYFESKGIVPDASTMIPYAGANAYELANLLCKDPQLLVQSIQESLGGGR